MPLGTNELHYQSKRQNRTGKIVCGMLLAVAFACSLLIGVDSVEVYGPAEVAACYMWKLQMVFGSLFDPHYIEPVNAEVLGAQPHFYQITERFGISFVTAVCGALLALAGSVYQLAFRNPIAAPTMLGASNGVRLGLMAVVLFYGTGSAYLLWQSYAFALICALLLLAVVFGLARLVTPRGKVTGIVDLLLVGTIVSSLTGTLIMYVQDYVMSEGQYSLFTMLSEALSVNTGLSAWVVLAVAVLLGVVPLFVCRFGINLLAFEDADARVLGMDVRWARLLSVALATLMMVIAQLLVGTVSMICLVVPHLSRMLFGANFSRQLPANLVIGALLLTVCRVICSLIPFTAYGLPIGAVVSIVALPAFVWIIAMQQRGWVVDQ